MVEVEDCYNAINKLQRNFHSGVIDKMEENGLLALAKDWEEQFKYWALSDFKKVMDHIITNNKYFPKPSTFWAIKKKIIEEDRGEIIRIFNCEYCKETGIRTYKDKDGTVHICRCDCLMGKNCYKHLPFMSEIKSQGLSEYRIHDIQRPFAFIPQGEGFRLSREIAGNNDFMQMILDNAEKRLTHNLDGLVKPMFQDKRDNEELPF